MLANVPRCQHFAECTFDRLVAAFGRCPRALLPSCRFQCRRGNFALCGQVGVEIQPGIDEAGRGNTRRYPAQVNRGIQCCRSITGNWHRTAVLCFASAPWPRNSKRQRGDAVGVGLVYNAKWAVYKRQEPDFKRATFYEDIGERRTDGFTPEDGKGDKNLHALLPWEGRSSAMGKPKAPHGEALLRRIWKKQSHLSPAQAADTAYFLALRPNPPEALLQQLTAYILHRHPERSLSILGLHRLLRVFYLAPGVAERSVLDSLCTALQLRVGRMKPADLQLLLADFAAIYTPQFLPLFVSAGRALRRKHEEQTLTLRASSGFGGGDAVHVCPPSSSFPNSEDKGEFLSPLQAAYLLHSYGRTDCRDLALFSIFLHIVDTAVCQLVQAQRQIAAHQGDPAVPQGRGGDQDDLEGLETSGQLNGEALVMCVKGLANVDYRPSEAQRQRLAELLIPYLLNEESSILGHAPPARRLPLLFGVISAFARLGSGPQELRRLIEEACYQPLTALGPYEPCDLLATALALQPIAALTSRSAAAAVADVEEQIKQRDGAGAGLFSSLSATAAPPAGSGAVAAGGSDQDPWSKVPDNRLSPSSSFRSAAHCYAATLGVGLAALRPSLFSLHPAFRVSILGTLVSLDAVLDPASRPCRIAIMREETNDLPQPTGTNSPRLAPFRVTDSAGSSTDSAAPVSQRPSTPSVSVAGSPRAFTPRLSGEVLRVPLNPLLRAALLSVFYRLPCVSLRLLVELLEALRACDFERRETEEHLCPHGKSQRWHRPLMAVLAREAVRKMQHSTLDAVVRFLVLYYVELNGHSVSLDPLHYGLHRLGRLEPCELVPYAGALSALFQHVKSFYFLCVQARPEGAEALQRLTAPGGCVAGQFLNVEGKMQKAAVCPDQ